MRRPGRREEIARIAAPAVFLVAMTILVLLVRSGLNGGSSPAPTAPVTTATAPVQTTASTSTATTATQPKPPAKQYYTIARGDTFGVVAAKFATTVEALQALNPGISSNSLTIGQRIRVK